MNKNLSRSWFVAITLVAGFALASCGGGGSKLTTLTPLEQALADRDAALTALEAAEQRATDAEAARMMAEEAASAAETAKMAADTARMTAEQSATDAETAKMMAEDARDTADRLRMEAETAAMNSAMDAADKLLAAEEAENRAMMAESDQMMAESERDEANMRAAAAESERMMAESERDEANMRAAAAESERMMAESERDAAMATARYTVAKNNSDKAKAAYVAAMAAYGRIDANVDEAEKLVELAGAAREAANTAKSEAAYGTNAQQAEAANAVTAANAAVSAANAEHAEAVMTAAASPYDKAIRTPATTPEISAMAARTGDDVTVEVLTGVAEGDASDAGNGWYRADVENEDDSAETATVYTNIENTMMLFSAVHTSGTDSISGATDGVLTLATSGNGALAGLNKFASSDDFPHSPDGELTITYDDATDSEHKRTFSGSFDKVPGDFSCDGTTCTITADADGAITELEGTWTFIPDYLGEDNESMAGDNEGQVASRKDDLTEPMVEVVDVDHLVFGWWTKVDEDDGSVAFRTFSDGTEAYNVDDIDDLEGTATYEGPAAGRYAVKTFTGNAKINSIRTGEFTATAELTATFGGDDVAVSQQDQISGRIHTFMDENDNQLLGELALGMVGELENLTTSDNSFDGVVTGGVGGSPATGSWSGQFFGNPPADPTDDVNMADDYPNSVAGEFDASSSHGSVAGAFGATR